MITKPIAILLLLMRGEVECSQLCKDVAQIWSYLLVDLCQHQSTSAKSCKVGWFQLKHRTLRIESSPSSRSCVSLVFNFNPFNMIITFYRRQLCSCKLLGSSQFSSYASFYLLINRTLRTVLVLTAGPLLPCVVLLAQSSLFGHKTTG